jgi:hypothetical protein
VRLAVAADQVAHEEVAAPEVDPVLVDHHAQVEPLLEQHTLLVRRARGQLPQSLECRSSGERADEVLVRVGHDVRVADRPAALGDDGMDAGTREHDAHRAAVDDGVVDDQPVASRRACRGCHPADHREARPVGVESSQQPVDREGERVGEQHERRVVSVEIAPADDRVSVGRLLEIEVQRRDVRVGQARGEQRERGPVFDLVTRADDGDHGHAEQHPG